MKTVASFPAFDVIDLETDLIHMSREVLKGNSSFRFCVSKETARHGNLYPEVSPYCVAYYALDYNRDPVAEEERESKLHGAELYWINLCSSSLTSHNRPSYTMILLKAGQKVLMNGKTLEVVDKGRGYWGLKEVTN